MAGEAPGKKVDPTSTRYDADKARIIVSRIVWLIFVACAFSLAVAALLYSFDANEDNNLVNIFYSIADKVDLGFFDIHENPIKDFQKDNGDLDIRKTALFNYGVGAILYLIVGRVLEKLIHP
jgi:hypothetical protein